MNAKQFANTCSNANPGETTPGRSVPQPTAWDIARRQLPVVAVLGGLLVSIMLIQYVLDRQREWRLREEQAAHRLEVGKEMITRDIERVTSDVRILAGLDCIADYVQLAASDRAGEFDAEQAAVENIFSEWLRQKQTYQQLRLISPTGREVVRVDWSSNDAHVVAPANLQDKRDRYYVQESKKLAPGQVFISEFDLNQEFGEIERPLNPVIRFATPVVDRSGSHYLLVANYRGTPLLNELGSISLPGTMFVVRQDGHFLVGPSSGDAWGWLLQHDTTFASRFPDAWAIHKAEAARLENNLPAPTCWLTSAGVFAFQEIDWTPADRNASAGSRSAQLLLVSFLARDEVFSTSNQLLYRLTVLAVAMLLPIFFLTRLWALATARRDLQNRWILDSERQLRDLSSRLVNAQEEERRAISREIHDQLGQQATAVNLDLRLAAKSIAEDVPLQAQLQRTIAHSDELLATLHDFATRIRPVELDDLGLAAAIESQLTELYQRTGIDVDFQENLGQRKIPTVVAENVYRLIQESLNNVSKHSRASLVEVTLMVNEATPQEMLVRIEDNGVGVSHAPNPLESNRSNGRLGMLGMRERMDLLGARLRVAEREQGGMLIEAIVPF